MGRKSKSVDEYRKLAEEAGLTWVDKTPPTEVRNSTIWNCSICDRTFTKSYNNIKYGRYPCICRSKKHHHRDDYIELASRLNLTWTGNRLPKNVHESTEWFSKKQNAVFQSPYHALAYGKIPTMYADYIVEGV